MFASSLPELRYSQKPRPAGRSCVAKQPPRRIVTAYAAPPKTPEIVRTPREVLGVGQEADSREIKTAFRKLALQYHPDRLGGDEQHFVEILRAYEILVGRSDGKDGTEHADWDFHDWYWKFTMSRSRGASQKRSGSFQADLPSQLAGLRQRAAVRAAKARAEQHTCVHGSSDSGSDDDFVDCAESPSDSGAVSGEDSFNPYERMAEEARRRARLGSSEAKAGVTSQLTGLKRRAQIRQEL